MLRALRVLPYLVMLAGAVATVIGGVHDVDRRHGVYGAYCTTSDGTGDCLVPGYPSPPAPYYMLGGFLVVGGGLALVARRRATRGRGC